MKGIAQLTSMVNKVPQTLKQKGFFRTIRRIHYYFEGYLFDMKYHTDSFSPVVWDASELENTFKKRIENYDSVQVISIRKMFSSLGIEPGKVLVDLGCGKGRILLLASEFGFKEVRGIEISPLLCTIARNNCALYKAKTKSSTEFTVIESDLCEYKVRDDEDVFYNYNTVKADALKKILQDICESFHRRQRKIRIIYCNPVYTRNEMDISTGIPVKVLNLNFRKNNFVVFEIAVSAT